MRLKERGQRVQSIQRMAPNGREPATAEATEARVVPGTRDPLGMMQSLRTVEWSATREVTSPVYDGHKLYEVHAKLASALVAVACPREITARQKSRFTFLKMAWSRRMLPSRCTWRTMPRERRCCWRRSCRLPRRAWPC